MPEGLENLDEKTLEAEVAKATEVEETVAEPTPAKTSADKKEEEVAEEEPSRAETSLKTEKEEPAAEDDESRFDKHPRWQKLKQERDDAVAEASSLRDIREKIGNFDADELTRLKDAAKLLRENPTLATKFQKIIDEFPFENEAINNKFNQVIAEQTRINNQLVLEKYDTSVNKLMVDNKVDKEVEPIVKELLDNRVIKNNLTLEQIPDEVNKILKAVETIRRKTLASYVEVKKGEPKVPASSTQRGKVILTKKESEEVGDVVDELTEGLRSARPEIKTED